VTCDDGIDCTDDTCIPATGCQYTPNNGNCDNGLYCDGEETCDPGSGCQAGTPVDCNDGVFCTIDSCEEFNQSCANVPSSGLCDDTLYCNGVETCDALLDCQPGTPVDCNDGDGCTIDSCDEGADMCINTDTRQMLVQVTVEALVNQVTRDVTFVLTDCGVGSETVVKPVTFNTLGVGIIQLTPADLTTLALGDVDYMQATEGHTLSSVVDVDFGFLCFLLLPYINEDTLLAGDLSNDWVAQDGLVDTTDFSVLAIEWEQSVDPNLGTLADVTGDGNQNMDDFDAIQLNFGKVGDPVDSCPTLEMSTQMQPRYRIPVAELGMPDADLADVNRDGMIDAQDIRLFAEQHGLVLRDEFLTKLEQLEAAPVQRSSR
jgi:hypothetical protein